jgi:hypothetical protein
MSGGNTYTGSSSEPTIQDYENVFGPSARDIKSDLQRFKRHGRWHLPDVLKGPNPWLTDRVDGLITDATNSPFTTRILPYMYKEDVEGKMKWNVWSFDEGMASRVPYESAARTLTQSKRSFSGYMVRQGMAISMEHNFMMSPKGRENFKNQLNQLIGSIQYTNDLDVHMALVLAPSYQKTMREKYFSHDKAPSQICREFCDLFGMMQKNANALDILIEEAKAVLKTWGGPMPDFLLCNSKLTFQMTMTPEKTNYLTQGTDGVKRLKQGPDLASYRGLSVIHSRAFAMEAGQHPRDILRRRVRTAEYYRILPNKENIDREFELYNEDRDTWFGMTFHDLLRYAQVPAAFYVPHKEEENDSDEQYAGGAGYGVDNPSQVMQAYHACLSGSRMGTGGVKKMQGLELGRGGGLAFMQLGVELSVVERDALASERDFIKVNMQFPLELLHGVVEGTGVPALPSGFIEAGQDPNSGRKWSTKFMAFDFGIKHIPPTLNFPLWNDWVDLVGQFLPEGGKERCVCCLDRLTPGMAENLFLSMQHVPLNYPFIHGEVVQPQTLKWYIAYTFYQEVYKRFGLCMGAVPIPEDAVYEYASSDTGAINMSVWQFWKKNSISIRDVYQKFGSMDISNQFLSMYGATGSVNHHFHLTPNGKTATLPRFMAAVESKGSCLLAKSFLLTYEVLEPLLRQYIVGSGKVVTGINYITSLSYTDLELDVQTLFGQSLKDLMGELRVDFKMKRFSVAVGNVLKEILEKILSKLPKKDPFVEGVDYLCRHGINTWPMGLTSTEFGFHPLISRERGWGVNHSLLDKTFGVLNLSFLDTLDKREGSAKSSHPFDRTDPMGAFGDADVAPLFASYDGDNLNWADFWRVIHGRIFQDPVRKNPLIEGKGNLSDGRPGELQHLGALYQLPPFAKELETYVANMEAANPNAPCTCTVSDSKKMANIVIDMNALFKDSEAVVAAPALKKDDILENVEIVIIRPNIEHNMLGIIMGLGGNELGHTLWGQTELSCYDDSMHGLWGMSYKYHQRAIVFNEKNLIRLWDIAYDGYNGGKDDTYVDWVNEDEPRNGVKFFREQTVDLSKSYRGPSMMVMAFVHDKKAVDPVTRNRVFDSNFKRNWPSPIVFHEVHNPARQAASANETLPLDSDNIQVVDVGDFRVFNSELYTHSYSHYREIMPSFHELHKMRKTAGQSSAEAETQTDSLAFQGSMRIKQDGRVIQEIQGSGHHGSDYVGVASIRAGKGIKYTGQAPVFSHMV